MKIAIASTGKDEDSYLSQRAGRSPYYLIFEDKVLTEVLKNPFAFGSGGAGFSVAYMLAEKGVDKVILGEVGENMKKALEENGVKYEKEKEEKIKNIIRRA